MKKDFKKQNFQKLTRRHFSEASSEAFTEIYQKLKLNRKRNVANTLF